MTQLSNALQWSTKNPAQIYQAYALLLEARNYANDLGCGAWDFAVEIQPLTRLGMTNSDLRWLVCMSYLKHAEEVRPATGQSRSFASSGYLTFTDRTCFILTPVGAEFAAMICNELRSTVHPEWYRASDAVVAEPTDDGMPHWDLERRELTVGGVLVKQFKLPAPNQEAILSAFEEDGWPPRIDDPVPPRANQDPKRRLNETITSLNRKQQNRLVRFLGDGSGQGIRWELQSARSEIRENEQEPSTAFLDFLGYGTGQGTHSEFSKLGQTELQDRRRSRLRTDEFVLPAK